MLQYRVGINKTFVAAGEGVKYGDKVIKAVAVYFEYLIFDKTTGEQIFFSTEDNEYPEPQLIDGHDLDEYFSCNYDREKGYVMKPTEICNNSRYRVEFRVNGHPAHEVYYVDPFAKDEIEFYEKDNVLKSEFIKILKDNPDKFDIPANVNARSFCYDYNEISWSE